MRVVGKEDLHAGECQLLVMFKTAATQSDRARGRGRMVYLHTHESAGMAGAELHSTLETLCAGTTSLIALTECTQ